VRKEGNAGQGYINRRTIKVVKMLRRLRYTVPSCVIWNLCTTRAVDKIFVLGVLIWLPKAALLGAQCLA